MTDLLDALGLSAPPTLRRIKRPPFWHCDFETWSLVDLTEVGASRYTRDPSTEVLMLAWALEDEEIGQWVPAETGDMTLPAEVEDRILDERIAKVAWNASFERQVFQNVLGVKIPFNQWRCMMVLGLSLSLPANLDKAGRVVGLPMDKAKSVVGKSLVRRFTMPRKPTKYRDIRRLDHITNPEEWEVFKGYNRQDIVAERAFWKKCWRWDLPEHEWEMYWIDQEINEAGVPINTTVVENTVKMVEDATKDRLDRMRAICAPNDPDFNPNSNVQLLGWLQSEGYIYDDMKKGHIERAYEKIKEEGDPNSPLGQVLAMRQEVARTSVKKYAELQRSVDADGMLRNTTQFAGAGRTWRWSGRGFQVHNLVKPLKQYEKDFQQIQMVQHLEAHTDYRDLDLIHGSFFDVATTAVRPTIQAPEGYEFADADLNAIENRVLGWMAQDPKILQIYADKLDPYLDFARYMFGGTYADKKAEFDAGNKKPRTTSKPAVLGCGYMLSAGERHENEKTGEIEGTGLVGYALNMGVELTQAEAILAVKVWRETFKEAPEFWYAIERAARKCIITQKPSECWPVRFDISGPFMRMILPSGRALHYCRPKIERKLMPWGKFKNAITYEGWSDGQWKREQTHPGKLTENADQAISRDLLAHGIRLARAEGLDVRLHVHDQIVALIMKQQSNWGLSTLLDCMSVTPDWGKDIPGKVDLPLGAAGALSRYFLKD